MFFWKISFASLFSKKKKFLYHIQHIFKGMPSDRKQQEGIVTTIRVDKNTRDDLRTFKENDESFNSVIVKLINFFKQNKGN